MTYDAERGATVAAAISDATEWGQFLDYLGRNGLDPAPGVESREAFAAWRTHLLAGTA